jgi:eukaryotic-like serine/threonine-protein kinase
VISPGARLGQYEILSALGAGGMGEVYRARDMKLDRDVAIKVLPEQFVADPERVARFQREAKTLAALNHPHIGGIYGLEDAGGVRALVLELVDGPTLADRIAQGRIPLDEALPIARQIAEALEAAHEQGIIHRDLKPANIKLRPDGTVKVLDFGLAKALEPVAGTGGDMTASPTITSPALTQRGVILGTAAYMSPEQAKGRAADKRSDMWAFGCVLYEMLTGRRVFDGTSVPDTLANVLKSDPDWQLLSPTLPTSVHRLLRRCLEKDRKRRLAHIADATLEIEEAQHAAEEPSAARPASRGKYGWRSPRMAALAVAVAMFALALRAVFPIRESAAPTSYLRLSIPIPERTTVGYLELSPDGRQVLLMLIRDGKGQFYVRSLDSDALRALPGTDDGRSPFWSPDSRFIGFFANNDLKVIPASGGPPQVLCPDAGLGRGGTWNRDGVILFSDGQLRRVDAKGGPCNVVGQNKPKAEAAAPIFAPIFLRDGAHFLYLRASLKNAAESGVYVATLDESVGHKVLADESSVVYTPPRSSGAPAHLLFLRESTLMAQPFDDTSFQSVGDPFAVIRGVSRTMTPFQVAATAAADGRLLYLAAGSNLSQLTWFDRTGKELGKVGSPGSSVRTTIAPNGSMAAISRIDNNDLPAVWLVDLIHGSESRVTAPGVQIVFPPVWSPESRAIWFTGVGSDGPGIYEKDLKTGVLRLVEKADLTLPKRLSDWSRDGRRVVYAANNPKTRWDIWYAPVEAGTLGQPPVKMVSTDAAETQGQLSPDGKWLAYCLDESGKWEVAIRPFPTGDRLWKIPAGEKSFEPRWRSDGKELFFMSVRDVTHETLMAVAVGSDGHGGLHMGLPQRLFDTHAMALLPGSNSFSYGPHPDGQRFLVATLVETEQPTVNVITNWQSAVTDAAKQR